MKKKLLITVTALVALTLIPEPGAQQRKFKRGMERTRVTDSVNVSEIRIIFTNNPVDGSYVVSSMEGTVVEGTVMEEDSIPDQTLIQPGPTPTPSPAKIKVFREHGGGAVNIKASNLTDPQRDGINQLVKALIGAYAGSKGLELEPEPVALGKTKKKLRPGVVGRLGGGKKDIIGTKDKNTQAITGNTFNK